MHRDALGPPLPPTTGSPATCLVHLSLWQLSWSTRAAKSGGGGSGNPFVPTIPYCLLRHRKSALRLGLKPSTPVLPTKVAALAREAKVIAAKIVPKVSF